MFNHFLMAQSINTWYLWNSSGKTWKKHKKYEKIVKFKETAMRKRTSFLCFSSSAKKKTIKNRLVIKSCAGKWRICYYNNKTTEIWRMHFAFAYKWIVYYTIPEQRNHNKSIAKLLSCGNENPCHCKQFNAWTILNHLTICSWYLHSVLLFPLTFSLSLYFVVSFCYFFHLNVNEVCRCTI